METGDTKMEIWIAKEITAAVEKSNIERLHMISSRHFGGVCYLGLIRQAYAALAA